VAATEIVTRDRAVHNPSRRVRRIRGKDFTTGGKSIAFADLDPLGGAVLADGVYAGRPGVAVVTEHLRDRCVRPGPAASYLLSVVRPGRFHAWVTPRGRLRSLAGHVAVLLFAGMSSRSTRR